MSANLKLLQQDLTENLGRAQRYRKIIRFVKTPVFAAVALWMVGLVCMPFALPYLIKIGAIAPESFSGGGFQNVIMGYFFPTAIACMVLAFTFSTLQKRFARIEQDAITRIVNELFPTAKMDSIPQLVSGNILKNSLLFGRMNSSDEVPAVVFASLKLPSENRMLHVVDLGVIRNRAETGTMLDVYVELFRQIFKSRVEMASYLFRGMFAWAELEKRIPGSIVVMPDHLEDKLGYIARHLQTMKNRGEMTLTTLEDPEFERLFAVYSTDEVLTRYILTPAMMRNITELRNKYGRDMMLSFNANRFCIAVAMPDGFMKLGGKAIKNGNMVEEIYTDIQSTQSILTHIKLDKIA